MTRSGFMGQEVTRGLAALQMRCLMPCLLFSRVLPAVSPRLLVLNWPMLLLPLAMVPIGLALGKLVALLSGSLVRPQDHWIVVCATAFPNSISLPTVLLTVVQEILYRGGAAVPPDGLVADPLVFVGFYQPVHMTLLWALGGWLLGVNMEQTPEEAAPPRPARGGGGASAASTTASSRTGSAIELSVLEADARASPLPASRTRSSGVALLGAGGGTRCAGQGCWDYATHRWHRATPRATTRMYSSRSPCDERRSPSAAPGAASAPRCRRLRRQRTRRWARRTRTTTTRSGRSTRHRGGATGERQPRALCSCDGCSCHPSSACCSAPRVARRRG